MKNEYDFANEERGKFHRPEAKCKRSRSGLRCHAESLVGNDRMKANLKTAILG